MITATIDSICRSILLRKRIPLHFYLDCFLSARDVIRELTIDDLQIVNVKELPVGSYGAVTLPNDCADVAEVSIGVGAKRRLLVPDNSLNEINYFDTSFNLAPYSSSNTGDYYYGYFTSIQNTDAYGESLGGNYGTATNSKDTYKVFRSKGEIQLNESLSSSNVIVAYIGDGRNADAASHIDVNAESTIEAYVLWQLCEMSRSYSMGEKDRLRQMYLNQRGILRARMADWSIAKIKRIVEKNQRTHV